MAPACRAPTGATAPTAPAVLPVPRVTPPPTALPMTRSRANSRRSEHRGPFGRRSKPVADEDVSAAHLVDLWVQSTGGAAAAERAAAVEVGRASCRERG